MEKIKGTMFRPRINYGPSVLKNGQTPSSLSLTRLSSLIFSELNVCKIVAKTPEFFLCSSASE